MQARLGVQCAAAPLTNAIASATPMSADNAYERQRAAKIAENKAKLAQLGLIEASRALLTSGRDPGISLEAGTEAQPRKKRRVIKEVPLAHSHTHTELQTDRPPTRLQFALRTLRCRHRR